MIEEKLAPFASSIVYIAAAVAFALSLGLTPLMKKIALKANITDKPDGNRKLQQSVVPYLGGPAIVISFLLSGLCLCFLDGGVPKEYLVISAGTLLMSLFGLADDIRDLKPLVKFCIQILLSVITVVFLGGIETVHLFGTELHLGIFSAPLTVLWITLVVNSFNMIDGLDGLSCGISILSLAFLAVLFLWTENAVFLVLCVSLGFACLGFLPWNYPSAKIYLGDSGALAIGYAIGCFTVYGLFRGTDISAFVPALVAGLPVSDTVELFFYRIIRGRNPFSADREHVHYKLTDHGVPAPGATLILYVLGAVYGLSAIAFVSHTILAWILAAIALGTYVFIKFLPLKRKNEKEEVNVH